MKKLLLSLAVVAACSFASVAETYTYSMNDVKEDQITGTFYETVYSDSTQTTVKSYARWQPLEKVVIGDFTMAFAKGTSSTEPAFYTAKTGSDYTVRVYNGNTWTITAPEGGNMISIALKGSGGKASAASSVSTGAIGDNTASSITWTGSSNEVVFTMGNTWRMTTIEITTGEGGETPDTPTTSTIYNIDFTAGQGEWTINDQVLPEGLTYVWAQNSTYGMKASAYANSTTYAVESWLVSPVIDLTEVTIPTLVYNQCGNYFTDVATFTTEATVWAREEGEEWSQLTVTNNIESLSWSFVDTKADLAAYAGKKMQIGFKYTSTATKSGTWEIKYVTVSGHDNAGVTDIVADEVTAPSVYYNLQGVRVANPENGVFIRVQGNKVSKVLVK